MGWAVVRNTTATETLAAGPFQGDHVDSLPPVEYRLIERTGEAAELRLEVAYVGGIWERVQPAAAGERAVRDLVRIILLQQKEIDKLTGKVGDLGDEIEELRKSSRAFKTAGAG